MKKGLYWLFLILMVVAGAAAAGVYKARHDVIKQSTTDSKADSVLGASGQASGVITPTDQTNPSTNAVTGAAAPATTSDQPLTLPALAKVKYNAKTAVEGLAVNAVNDFEQAINRADATAVAKVMADTVDVSTLPVDLKNMTARPISFSIDSIVTNADDTVTLAVTESRQDVKGSATPQKRKFDLIPRQNDYAVAAYYSTDNTKPTSGLAN